MHLRLPADLQLCDMNSAGSVQCSNLVGGCTGSSSGNCGAAHLWSSPVQPDGNYYNPYLGSGTFNAHYRNALGSISVRFVIGFLTW